MGKNIAKVVTSNPHVLNIELGAGCDEFGSKFYSHSFLTDIKSPNKSCKGSMAPLYFTANANEISNHVPDNRFELIICCNPYNYGFKTPFDAFTMLKQFNSILIPKKGIIRIIGAKGVNPHFNTVKIRKFISQFNDENKTLFNIIEERTLSGLYPGFTFKDSAGKEVFPNTEIIIANNND